MEEIGGEINYPRIEQIVDVNRRMIKEFGGLFLEPDNIILLIFSAPSEPPGSLVYITGSPIFFNLLNNFLL